MEAGNLKVTNGELAGAWIEPRLGGAFGAVTVQVPKGYEAYARVFHPAYNRKNQPIRWAEVAKPRGMTVHQEMQWEALTAHSEWDGLAPSLGGMDFADLDALCEILGAHTPDPDRCYF